MPSSTWRVRLADSTELVFERHYEVGYSRIPDSEPDPDWEFTDEAGHEHYWEGNLHPTLEERWEDYLDDPYDSDPYFQGYFCTECGEKVKPKYRTIHGSKYFTTETGRELYREGGLLCATREEVDALMPYMTHTTYGPSCAAVYIHQNLTPAQAVELVSTIGLHERALTSKERVIEALKGMVEGSGGVAGQHEGPEVR